MLPDYMPVQNLAACETFSPLPIVKTLEIVKPLEFGAEAIIAMTLTEDRN